MKKKHFIVLLILFIIISSSIYFYIKSKNNSNPNTENYETSKTSTDEENNQNEDNNSLNKTSNENENNNNVKEETKGITKNTPTPKEENLSSFSTKIYSSDSARQNNIQITCNTLNGSIVKSGETFSFCQTVGKATSARGYKEADIYDHDGKKKKGLGGRKLSS